MEWIILFLINWIVFLLLVDWKGLKINIWSGLFATVMAIFIDYFNSIQGRYIINRPIIDIMGSSLFFLLGPVFVIGTLLAQYHPKKRLMVVANTFVLFTIYSIVELILVNRGAVEYLGWGFIDSLVINLGVMSTLSWFSIVVLNKWSVEK